MLACLDAFVALCYSQKMAEQVRLPDGRWRTTWQLNLMINALITNEPLDRRDLKGRLFSNKQHHELQ